MDDKNRVVFQTTLDKDLVKWVKVYATTHGYKYNDILEHAIRTLKEMSEDGKKVDK